MEGCVYMPEETKVSKAQQKAVNKYVKTTMIELMLLLPKVAKMK